MKKIKVISRIKEIRKGKNEQRKKVVFEEGEPVFITDKNRLYIGDNKTYGGIDAVSKNHMVETTSIPQHGVIYDLLYNKKTKCVSIINIKDSLINLTPYECRLNTLSTLVTVISTKIDQLDDPEKQIHIATDLDSIIFEDNILTDIPDTIDRDKI
jgi:hypothetical protein